MPEYLYGCRCGQRITIVHGMLDTVQVDCPGCGLVMHRVPQLVRVNWSGVRYHPSPAIRRFLDDTPRRREEYEENHHG